MRERISQLIGRLIDAKLEPVEKMSIEARLLLEIANDEEAIEAIRHPNAIVRGLGKITIPDG